MPGVYPVQAKLYDAAGNLMDIQDRYARWTGAWWCCWANTPERAVRCEFRGPTDGYSWYNVLVLS